MFVLLYSRYIPTNCDTVQVWLAASCLFEVKLITNRFSSLVNIFSMPTIHLVFMFILLKPVLFSFNFFNVGDIYLPEMDILFSIGI